MAKYILPLTDEHVTLDLVGGKGASLARLTRADIPVPDGFCVTTTAYRQFVKENALQSQIIALLAKADISNPKTGILIGLTFEPIIIGTPEA